MKLKICGITDHFKGIIELNPNYLGFNFWESSSRYFRGKIPELPETIKKTGIFVDMSMEKLFEKTTTHQLQAVQLHGQEDPEYCKVFRDAAAIFAEHSRHFPPAPPEIIKAFAINDDFDFSALQPYEEVCDYFLFDTRGKLPGGNGYAFNWELLKAYPSTKPYFLSGGIGLENVDSLLSFLKKPEAQYCYAIDVNSKFETEPGHKDIEKLKAFKRMLSAD